MNRVLRSWLILVAASAATTALAAAHVRGHVAVVVLLVLALVKARVILADFLGLRGAPQILRGFMAVFGLWAGIALTLAIAAQS